ncbi:YqeB family protein [Dactylosporangium sp. CS-047395]|uniref:YqeB family protein n=1 Tax=Dactylosporangium sp. CS-047395 TaxID=3239936 RepID=UPI003D936360
MADHELGLTRGDRALLFGGLPLLGGLAGWGLPALARWLLSLPWVPFAGPLRLVRDLDSGWGLVAIVAAGVLLGGVLGLVAVHESLRVTVADAALTFVKGDDRRTVERRDVDHVFVDGKVLVVLDRQSRQVVRDRLENAGSARVEQAFRSHGYPWVAADPYETLYRRWVPDLPDLPAAVNAVLAARAKALEAKSAADADELRDEVQKLGFTVRDVGTTQHWRPLVRT